MQLLLVIGFCLIGARNMMAQQVGGGSVFETACGILTEPGVICVSKTQFVLAYQNPTTDTPMKCPPNTFCADVPEVCSAFEPPACYNEVVGSFGVCNICPLEGPYNPICVSPTEYGFCVNGRIQQAMKYECQSPTPYCKATFDLQMHLVGICTADNKTLDCPLPPAQPSNSSVDLGGVQNGTAPNNTVQVVTDAPTSSKSSCLSEGLAANPDDSTCRSYINCQPNPTGGLNANVFNCTELGSVFDPATGVCVPAGSYTCPQPAAPL